MAEVDNVAALTDLRVRTDNAYDKQVLQKAIDELNANRYAVAIDAAQDAGAAE